MGNPIFRFTLSHDTLGTKQISEPIGWKDAKIKLTRDPEFSSLIEYFEADLVFYGSNGRVDGGLNFIRSVEAIGLDETCNIHIEVSFNSGSTYKSVFTGQLDLTSIEENDLNQAHIPIIRNDLWVKFTTRYDTPVNIQSPLTVDNGTAIVHDPIKIDLPSQTVRYIGEYTWKETFQYSPSVSNGEILIIDWDTTVIDDIKKFSLPRATVVQNGNFTPAGIFEAPYDGIFSFDIRIEASSLISGPYTWLPFNTAFYIMKASDAIRTGQLPASPPTQGDNNIFAYEIVTYPNGDSVGVYTYKGYFKLFKGDQIVVYGWGSHLIGSTVGITVFGSQIDDWKTDCRIATVFNVTLSGLQTIDGISGADGDRVLVWKQSDQRENGIWIMHSGAWVRAIDADTSNELIKATVKITAGSVNINACFRQAEDFISIGDTPINFITTTQNNTKFKQYPGYPAGANTYFKVTGDTTFIQTDTRGFLIHDAAQSVLERITDIDQVFYSEYFGGLQTIPVYIEDGCASGMALAQGYQVRGVNIIQKPVSLSFSDWWKGANPIFNLGLSYDVINGKEVIRCEPKAYFYDRETSVNISNIKSLTRKYDTDFLINKIEIGFNKWQSEDLSAIDDPQGKHTYATRLHKIDKGLSLYSTFVAAGSAIEMTRRQGAQKVTDYKFDTDLFIIHVKPVNSSPDTFTPYTDEQFNQISNLLNPSTRYNILLTPLRSMLRWLNYVSGALTGYFATDSIKFASGEGNLKMYSDFACTGNGECLAIVCDGLFENQSIPLATYADHVGYLHLPFLYTIDSIDMNWETYEAIRNNRQKSIGISQTNTGFKAIFIKEMEYYLASSKATITGWSTEFIQPTSSAFSKVDQLCNVDYRITEESEHRILENGEKRSIN